MNIGNLISTVLPSIMGNYGGGNTQGTNGFSRPVQQDSYSGVNRSISSYGGGSNSGFNFNSIFSNLFGNGGIQGFIQNILSNIFGGGYPKPPVNPPNPGPQPPVPPQPPEPPEPPTTPVTRVDLHGANVAPSGTLRPNTAGILNKTDGGLDDVRMAGSFTGNMSAVGNVNTRLESSDPRATITGIFHAHSTQLPVVNLHDNTVNDQTPDKAVVIGGAGSIRGIEHPIIIPTRGGQTFTITGARTVDIVTAAFETRTGRPFNNLGLRETENNGRTKTIVDGMGNQFVMNADAQFREDTRFNGIAGGPALGTIDTSQMGTNRAGIDDGTRVTNVNQGPGPNHLTTVNVDGVNIIRDRQTIPTAQ